jgi:hypothetical protein
MRNFRTPPPVSASKYSRKSLLESRNQATESDSTEISGAFIIPIVDEFNFKKKTEKPFQDDINALVGKTRKCESFTTFPDSASGTEAGDEFLR